MTALLNQNGVVRASYYYDAFGVIIEQTGGILNPFRYAGYSYDEETQLYDLKVRFYDAKMARFLQEDICDRTLSVAGGIVAAHSPIPDPSGGQSFKYVQGESSHDNAA